MASDRVSRTPNQGTEEDCWFAGGGEEGVETEKKKGRKKGGLNRKRSPSHCRRNAKFQPLF